MQYKIVTSGFLKALELEVNKLLSEGWDLYGGFKSSNKTVPVPMEYREVAESDSTDVMVYYQVMTKKD